MKTVTTLAVFGISIALASPAYANVGWYSDETGGGQAALVLGK
jgi:hypothetical protein